MPSQPTSPAPASSAANTMTADYVVPSICMWRESRSNPEAYAGVAWVILNRAMDHFGRWSRTLTGVALQPWQFSSFNVGDPNATLFPNPKQVSGWKSFEEACRVLSLVVVPNGPIPDPTGGANHYHDHSIEPPVKSWLGKGKTLDDLVKLRTVTIGPFDFYKL